jgi:hypothetical protein
VDGTLCTLTEDSGYEYAQPKQAMIDKVNRLYNEGHTIKICTARGQMSGIDWEQFTKEQLAKWGVKYHEYHKKPSGDFYVDDKAMTIEEFLNRS